MAKEKEKLQPQVKQENPQPVDKGLEVPDDAPIQVGGGGKEVVLNVCGRRVTKNIQAK